MSKSLLDLSANRRFDILSATRLSAHFDPSRSRQPPPYLARANEHAPCCSLIECLWFAGCLGAIFDVSQHRIVRRRVEVACVDDEAGRWTAPTSRLLTGCPWHHGGIMLAQVAGCISCAPCRLCCGPLTSCPVPRPVFYSSFPPLAFWFLLVLVSASCGWPCLRFSSPTADHRAIDA